MIVAAGTFQSLCQKHVRRRLGDVAEDLLPLGFDIPLIPLIDPVPQIHRSDQCIAVARINFVAGKLFDNQPIIRLVFIERSNQIVAVVMRSGRPWSALYPSESA